MLKNIEIPEENNVLETLQIQAVKEKKKFNHYITSLLVREAEALTNRKTK